MRDASEDSKGLTPTTSAACTRACTSEAENTNAGTPNEGQTDKGEGTAGKAAAGSLESLAAALLTLSPADRAKLAAMLAGDQRRNRVEAGQAAMKGDKNGQLKKSAALCQPHSTGTIREGIATMKRDETPQNATPESLSPAQIAAVGAMLAGKTITDAAADAGVDRATVHRWGREDFAFQAAINAGRRELRVLYTAGWNGSPQKPPTAWNGRLTEGT